VDLAYLRSHPEHLPTFLTHQRIRETPVPGGSIAGCRRLTLEDGASVFAKSLTRPAPPGFFEAEATGLRWLRDAGAVPVPEVIVALPDLLVLEWIDHGRATPASAEQFGRELATLHDSGAESFGGGAQPGYIGSLPLDNTPHAGPWAPWFAQTRLRPYLDRSAGNGTLTDADVRAVRAVIDSIDRYAHEEPPSRIHGDLWPGNVLWAADGRGWLIDPAAQGGHRETDLATLALFGGAPYLDRIIAGYQAVHPLEPGWPQRMALHQLHLLLVHTSIFGIEYRNAVMTSIRDTVNG
jgi:fructosamine-3-kinase